MVAPANALATTLSAMMATGSKLCCRGVTRHDGIAGRYRPGRCKLTAAGCPTFSAMSRPTPMKEPPNAYPPVATSPHPDPGAAFPQAHDGSLLQHGCAN